MLWIENIVESTPPLPFLINSRVDMANFVDPYKVVVRRSAFFFFFQVHKMEVNWKAKPKKKKKNKELECQFSSQVIEDLNL